jgi:hypothetical protein
VRLIAWMTGAVPQIADQLRAAIERGELQPGDRLLAATLMKAESTFPVVVGERGLVSRWMPLCRQIRSNSTSAGPAGELTTIVRQHFLRRPVLGYRG